MIWRALVGWLLRSRARFFGMLAAALVGGLLLSSLTSTGDTPAPEAAAPPPPATTAAPPPSIPSQPPAPPSQTLPPRDLAVKVAELWVDSSPPQREWLAKLKPLVTEEYGAVTLAQVDPRNVPALQVLGPATLRESPDPGTAIADVPLDTLTLRVEMVDTGDGGWRVSSLAPEEETRGTA
ncbi:hypothetical protein [Pseudonocardia sp. ICBG1142]|uniref:hypothetical protein n=1 Tax=Pseudonocardia sp. ICBG1142 TaxID=2846760 RepID=UPI001CF6ED75|nr:hypothetical protein [Pseudonocardia sp. ICBG1142]